MLKKIPDTLPACAACSECFYHCFMKSKKNYLIFPKFLLLKESEVQYSSAKLVEDPEKRIGKMAGRKAGNIIEDTSGEVDPGRDI